MVDVELTGQAGMPLPRQSPPVRRPEVIAPHTCVDVAHGTIDQLVTIRMELMHGANYNDPAVFAPATYRQRAGRR